LLHLKRFGGGCRARGTEIVRTHALPRPDDADLSPLGRKFEGALAQERDRSRRAVPPSTSVASVQDTYRGYRASARKRRSWAADNPGNRAIRAELLAGVVELAAERLDGCGAILDIGCGGGWLLEQLGRRGVEPQRLHGVDLIASRAQAARRRLPEADIRLADARKLPYPDAEFELITLLTCLSSMPDRHAVRRALAEADRVLAPGGLLLAYEPRLANPFNRATVAVPRRLLRETLSRERESRSLTGLPPLARRLGSATPYLYPTLARALPTHRLTAWSSP
jgi:ubiquinone/menaquinone biosynthesis C-methylase UbiE